MTTVSDTGREGRKRIISYCLIFAAYLFAALVMTWPIIIHPTRYVISEEMDAVTAFYNLWWFHHALADLHTSFWTSPLIDHPNGYSMILFPIWIPYDALAFPIVSFGVAAVPVAFNLIFLLSTAAAGLAGFVLVRYITRNPYAAFIAGTFLAFLPYRIWNITRWHVTCLELLAPALYFFIRMIRNDSPRAGIGFILFATLLAYMSPNYTVDLAIALAALLAVMAVTDSASVFNRATAKRLIRAGLITALVCSPLLIRVAYEMLWKPVPLVQEEALRVSYSANLAGFILPGYTLRAFNWLTPHLSLADPALARPHGIMGYEIFIGIFAAIAALAGAILGRKRAIPFIVLAVLFIVMALGPSIQAGTHTMAGPYRWIEAIVPVLKVERAPVRHAGMAYVALAVLLGLGITAISARINEKRRRIFYIAAGAAVMLEFFQAPLPLTTIPIPGFVSEIKNDPAPGSVLDLPFLPLIQRFAGINQMNHERPLAIQLTRRINDPNYTSSPLFRYLDRPRVWNMFSEMDRTGAIGQLKNEFARRDVRYVVIYLKFMEAEDVAGVREIMKDMGPDKMLEDGATYLVYRFAEPSAQTPPP